VVTPAAERRAVAHLRVGYRCWKRTSTFPRTRAIEWRLTRRCISFQLRSALARVMAQPAIRERLAVLGMRPIDIDPAAFQARIAEEFRSREVLIRDRWIEVH
jgi:tripartite-type tricarboxylate transporter receptor subunit TctC